MGITSFMMMMEMMRKMTICNSVTREREREMVGLNKVIRS